MGLREDQKELTRRKVLDAVLDLVADGSLDDLSVPAVSHHSGVSVATIYRHFATKDELISAAAAEPSRRALASDAGRGGDRDTDDLAVALGAMWHEFGANLPLLRHQLSSEAGREMRRARLDDARHRLASYLARSGIDPTTAAGERLISMLLLVAGSVALVELHDRQQLDIDVAIDHSLWAARSLIEATGGTVPTAEEPR